jgi:hypothetical protein
MTSAGNQIWGTYDSSAQSGCPVPQRLLDVSMVPSAKRNNGFPLNSQVESWDTPQHQMLILRPLSTMVVQ